MGEESGAPSVEPTPPLDGASARYRKRQRHPRGLYLLFFTEMWERFSYYGNRALLVPFMEEAVETGGFGWDKAVSGKAYGWYTGLVWLAPLFGGLLADKILGTHRSMVIGGVTIALGHGALACMDLFPPGSSERTMPFVAGLALIVLGTGFFKPCVSVMVGQLYVEGDSRRDAGFTIFYMGINVGAFLASFVCGLLKSRYGWSVGFGAAGVAMVAGLVTYVFFRPRVLHGIGLPPVDKNPKLAMLSMVSALGLVGGIGGVYWVVKQFVNPLAALGVAGAAALGLAGLFASTQRRGEKGPTAALFLVSFFVIFFWYAYEQAGSSLNSFAVERTDRSVPTWVPDGLGGLLADKEGTSFDAAYFQSVNPGYIILFAPVFAGLWVFLAKKGREPSTPAKMAIGLLLLGAGFAIMVAAGYASDGGEALPKGVAPQRVSAWWLMGAYLLHTWGELCLSPIGLSLVTKLAPQRFVSLMMGVWFLASAIAELLGGYTYSVIESVERGELFSPVFGGQADFWLVFVATSLSAGLLMPVLTPLMRRLMSGRG